MSFTNWANGAPTDNECVTMQVGLGAVQNGKWLDINCYSNTELYGICEKRIPETTTTTTTTTTMSTTTGETFLSGFIISGGTGSFESAEPKQSVELIEMNSGRNCSLPDLPANRWQHTQVFN